MSATTSFIWKQFKQKNLIIFGENEDTAHIKNVLKSVTVSEQ